MTTTLVSVSSAIHATTGESLAVSVGSSESPAIIANSVSFGKSQSVSSGNRGSSGAPGPGLSMLVAPASLPRSKARTIAGWGTSNWERTTIGAGSSSNARSTLSGVSASLAPAPSTMRFRPSGSTQIDATPL